MEERTVMKNYLHALWESTLQRILTVIDIAGLVGLFIIVIDDWVEFGYALVFVLLWFSSNYLTFKRQQERIKQLETSLATEQRSIDATLSLLTNEITQNLEAFKTYWKKVNQLGESSSDPAQRHLALAGQALKLILPTWSCTIWETQTPVLTKALSPEQLQQVQAVYSQLEEISGIYSKLQALMDEQQAYLKADSLPVDHVWGVAGLPRPFHQNAPMFWQELERVALELIEEGNPLRRP